MANFIGRLGVLLGLDSAEFTRGLERASKQLDSFVEKARTTSVAGGAAFAAMTFKALEYADQLSDTAKANDIAVDSVLKLTNALANSGGEAENAGKFLSSFTATVDKAAEGSFEVQKTFKSIGVSLGDLSKMGMDELFRKSVEGLANMSDPLTRNAKAMELFGKAAKGVDFVELNQQIQNGAGVTEQQAQAVNDMADAFDMLAQAGRDFSLMLATELGPPLKSTLEYIKQLKGDTNLVGAAFRTAFETIAVLGANVAFVFEAIADEISHTVENAKLLAKLDFKGATAANEAFAAKWEERRKQLDDFEQRIMSRTGTAETASGSVSGGGAGGSAGGRKVKPGIDKEAEAERLRRLRLFLKGFEEESRQREENNRLMAEQETMYQKGLAAQMERVRTADKQLDREKEMLELAFKGRNMRGEDLQFQQELLEIEYKRRDNIEKIKNDEKLDQEGREYGMRRENELAEKAIELARRRLELTRSVREGDLSDGFFNAMERAARNASTEFERGQMMFESMMSNMEQAIVSFARTGKLSFGDLARSIIQDMIAIQLKAQMLGLVRMLFGSIGGLTTAMSYGTNVGSQQTAMLAAQERGFADGGNPPVGQISLVGERGPELFVPRTAGTIIPNHQLASALGGGPSVVYNGPYIANMQAIDTQSATQFLAKNKQAVWSANQSAQRGLPVSR